MNIANTQMRGAVFKKAAQEALAVTPPIVQREGGKGEVEDIDYTEIIDACGRSGISFSDVYALAEKFAKEDGSEVGSNHFRYAFLAISSQRRTTKEAYLIAEAQMRQNKMEQAFG